MFKLIDDVKNSWKFTSVQSAALLAIANAFFAFIPTLEGSISLPMYSLLMLIGNLTVIFLRLVAQPSLDKKVETNVNS